MLFGNKNLGTGLKHDMQFIIFHANAMQVHMLHNFGHEEVLSCHRLMIIPIIIADCTPCLTGGTHESERTTSPRPLTFQPSDPQPLNPTKPITHTKGGHGRIGHDTPWHLGQTTKAAMTPPPLLPTGHTTIDNINIFQFIRTIWLHLSSLTMTATSTTTGIVKIGKSVAELQTCSSSGEPHGAAWQNNKDWFRVWGLGYLGFGV